MRKWPTQVSTVVPNVGRELSLLKMAINMANADYPSFFLWNELEPRCQQRAAGSLELVGLDKRNNQEHFQDVPFNPLNTGFFPTFSEQSMPLGSIAEKRLNRFSWNFQKRMDMTQEAIWNIFGMLRLTPWILGRFIYFLDPCLFVILWKKRVNGFSWNFHETPDMTQEIIS